MYRLTVSNGVSIESDDYSTIEAAFKAMEESYKQLGQPFTEDYCEDASYLGQSSAFHQGKNECNVFDISEIPNDVRNMTASEILASIDYSVKEQMYEALKAEMEDEMSR